MGDPVVVMILVSAAAVIALTIVLRVVRRMGQARRSARFRRERQRDRGFLSKQQEQLDELAMRIIATSSTTAIVGFEIVRQIEAVFTDGHTTHKKALQALKAEAAEKGANALINLVSERPPSSKCVARGDAVIVKPLEMPEVSSDSVGGDGADPSNET